MKDEVKTSTIITRTIKLSGQDIVDLLIARDPALRDRHTEVTFTVPTGADHSGDDIEIDEENPVIVTFITTRST